MTHIVIEKNSDHYLGSGVEYPGIIVWGHTEDEVIQKFKESIPTHLKMRKKYGITSIDRVVKQIEL